MLPDAPYQLALVAGMLAAFNPCGFALLPVYLTLLVARSDSATTSAAIGRALVMTLAMTVGFVAVFGGFGLVVVPAALSIESSLPWVTVVVGLGLTALGGWLAAGREIPFATPRLTGGAPTGSVWSMVVYGVAFAVASLSCTIAPFLALTTATFTASGVAGGIAAFGAYGVGMGLVVGTLAVAVALGRDAVLRHARRALPYVTRAGGVLLVLAGLYVTYYGIFELRVYAGAAPSDPVVDAALTVQGTLARFVGSVEPGQVAGVLAVLVAAGLGAAALRRRRIRRR
ncbi:MAG: cytochrome c biogenesis CcdA family protein [Jiangellaceae bacterium]